MVIGPSRVHPLNRLAVELLSLWYLTISFFTGFKLWNMTQVQRLGKRLRLSIQKTVVSLPKSCQVSPNQLVLPPALCSNDLHSNSWPPGLRQLLGIDVHLSDFASQALVLAATGLWPLAPCQPVPPPAPLSLVLSPDIQRNDTGHSPYGLGTVRPPAFPKEHTH